MLTASGSYIHGQVAQLDLGDRVEAAGVPARNRPMRKDEGGPSKARRKAVSGMSTKAFQAKTDVVASRSRPGEVQEQIEDDILAEAS